MFALSEFDKEELARGHLAVDLGCGIGNDSMELMKRGWSVLAIDKQPIALKRLSHRVLTDNTIKNSQLQKAVSSFEKLKLPSSILLNSSYALPFCQPDQFSKLWETITRSIQYGGRFAGHLFGKNDAWADDESMIFMDRSDINLLFKDFTIELFKEKDEMGNVANGDAKHWHLFSIVAKKTKL